MPDLAVRWEASLPCSLRNAAQPAAVVRVTDHGTSTEHGIGVTKVQALLKSAVHGSLSATACNMLCCSKAIKQLKHKFHKPYNSELLALKNQSKECKSTEASVKHKFASQLCLPHIVCGCNML